MKHLRQFFSQLSANPRELAKRAPGLCQAVVGEAGSLKFGGAAVTDAKRSELLAALKAGEHVELEVELLSYTQEAGVQNRKFLRFRDGAMVKLGRSGKETPFLRDHRQDDSLAVAGQVIASETVKLGEGSYEIRQTVRLTADWAVKIALEGNLRAVSIGWNPTGPILCSVHNAPVWSKPECYCWPGQRFAEKDGERGTKRLVRDPDGQLAVEFIYTEAELVETSQVPIGGVRNAHAEEIRASLFASLSAGNPGLASALEAEFQTLRGNEPEESLAMDEEELKKLRAALGLPDTASVTEVLAAAKTLQDTLSTGKAVTTIQSAELEKLNKQIETLNADKATRDQDAFIASALSSGRIGKVEEDNWRALYLANPTEAATLMAKRKANSVTPVGEPRQSGSDPDSDLDSDLDADEGAPPVAGQVPRIEGGDIPGGLYAVAERSPVETKEIRKQLSAAVKRLETHQSPQAIWWAQRLGFDGKLSSMPRARLTGSAIINDADLNAARTAFRAVFLQQLEMAAASPLEVLFTVMPSETPLAQINWMGDLPGFEEWTSERKMSGVEALKINLESKKWASGLRMKNDDIKFDRLGLMPQQVQELANKARRHRIDRMVKFLTQGFAGGTDTTGLGYDGAFFFANAHKGGNDNLNGTAALDATTLAAGELLLESMTTYDGVDALDTHGTHLIVGPKLRVTAEKLLTQERLANGEDNYHRGKYKLIVENRLRGTFDDYWYLADASHSIKPFILQMVEEISTSAIIGQDQNQSETSFMRDESMFGAQAHYNMSYFEFRLIVGTAVA